MGDNNDLEQDDDEEIENPLNQDCDDEEQPPEQQQTAGARGDSQLRHSHNVGLEGFEGIVGVGQGNNKKQQQKPTAGV